MMRALLVLLTLAGCNSTGDTPGAAAFVGRDIAVSPGLASCLTAIGRPEMADDPTADMTGSEIEGLLACTTERAAR